jgi:hypothetical protein
VREQNTKRATLKIKTIVFSSYLLNDPIGLRLPYARRMRNA